MLQKSKFYLISFPFILLFVCFMYGFFLLIIRSNIKEHFFNIIKNEQFFNSFFYALFISTFTTLLSLVLAFILAYLLFILRFEYKKDIKKWILFLQIPIFIPYALSAYLFFLLFFPYLIGSSVAIILAYTYKTVPFLLLLFTPYLLSMKDDEINLHKMYSNKRFIFFWKILTKKALLALFVGAFIIFFYVFNAYEIPYILGSYLDKMPSILVNEKFSQLSSFISNGYSFSLVFICFSLCFVPLFFLIYLFVKRYAF